ncbi:MAG: hypothetical protein V4496_05340 [Pseudomonadota bacterium]
MFSLQTIVNYVTKSSHVNSHTEPNLSIVAQSSVDPLTHNIAVSTQNTEENLITKLQALKKPITDSNELLKYLKQGSDETSSTPFIFAEIDFSGINIKLFSKALAECLLDKTITLENVTLTQYQLEQLYENLKANITQYSSLKQEVDTLIEGISRINISNTVSFSTFVAKTKILALVKLCSEKNLLSQDGWLSIYETVDKEVTDYDRHEEFLSVCFQTLLNKFEADPNSSNIEKFIADHADEYNNKVLDILLARAKTIEFNNSDYKNNDHFNQYWRPVLTTLMRNGTWNRLEEFIVALPYHDQYGEFINGISNTRCQQALFEKSGWNVSEDGEINFNTALSLAKEKAETGDTEYVVKVIKALNYFKGQEQSEKDLLQHAIQYDSPKLIQAGLEQKSFTHKLWNSIRKKAFEQQPKAWKVLEYCVQQLTEEEKNNPNVISFWIQQVLEAAIYAQQWSCAKTIVASFPYQQCYKDFYSQVTDVECQIEFQKSAGWSVTEEGPMPSVDALDANVNILEYLAAAEKLDPNAREKIVVKVLSSNEFCSLAKTLVDNDVINETHIELVTTWIIKKTDALMKNSEAKKPTNTPSTGERDNRLASYISNTHSFENDPRSIPLMESIAQKEIFMANNAIKSLCHNKLLNIASKKGYKKLENTLLNFSIFPAAVEDVVNHSADLSTQEGRASVERLKKILAVIRRAETDIDKYKNSDYIRAIVTLQFYVATLLTISAKPEKNGSFYSKSSSNSFSTDKREEAAILQTFCHNLQLTTEPHLDSETRQAIFTEFDALFSQSTQANKVTHSLKR